MKSLAGCRRGWTHCAVLLALAIALIVRETSSHPAGAVGAVPRRSHGSLPSRSGSSNNQQPRQHRRQERPIVRPAKCQDDSIFTDCFLCGKVAENYMIYHRCCHGVLEIVDFCTNLLT